LLIGGNVFCCQIQRISWLLNSLKIDDAPATGEQSRLLSDTETTGFLPLRCDAGLHRVWICRSLPHFLR